MGLIYDELTEQLIHGFHVVQNEVGLGRSEEAYHRAYKIWAEEQSLPVHIKPKVPLMIGDREVSALYPDFVAWNEISVELKSLPRRLGPAEDLQLFDYLRARGDRLGLLVNLGLDRVYVERRIFDPPQTAMNEDWSNWTGYISAADRDIGIGIRNAFHAVYAAHRTGYSFAVTEKLVLGAFAEQRLQVVVRPVVDAKFRQQIVHVSALECYVIQNRFVITLTSQFDSLEFAKSLGWSHMNTLELPWAVAANFGRTDLQLAALKMKHR